MMRSLVLLVFPVILLSCTNGEEGGCDTDKDCKGDRICDARLRLCVEPGAASMTDMGRSVSGLTICHAGCEASRRCGTLSDSQAAACNADCEVNSAALAAADAQADRDCAKAGDIRRQRGDCLMLECNRIQSCLAAIDTTCIREPPVPTACTGAAPMGPHYKFATSAIKLPTSATNFSLDIDGDGRADNQLKAIIGAIASANFDLQGPVDKSVKDGGVLLLDVQSGDLPNGCAWATLAPAKKGMSPPRFDGTDTFTVDNSQSPTALSGKSTGGKLTTILPRDLKPGDVQVLHLGLPLGMGLLPLTIYGAHVQGDVTASGVMSGQIHGVIRKTDIDTEVVPAVAQLLTEQIRKDPMGSTTETIIRLFEDEAGNPASKAKCMNTPEKCCKTPANRARTCEILPEEVRTNPLIGNVLAADVQVYQGGTWGPVPKGTMKDAMSVGLGFTAVRATF